MGPYVSVEEINASRISSFSLHAKILIFSSLNGVPDDDEEDLADET